MIFRPIALFLILVFACGPAAARQDTISGRASVVDGDTIAVEGTPERIRLHGIDAPEGKQTCEDAAGRNFLCGSRAAKALVDLIGRNGRVVCHPQDRDRYGRIVARCDTTDGVDINAAMVRSGWAVEYRRYSGGAYAHAQEAARRDRAGLWAGRFVAPEDWRRGKRKADRSGAPVTTVEDACRIKGNIGRSGRIYHVPGSPAYDSVRIDSAKGERWFCSEDEARDAGWRPVRGAGGAS